MGKRIILKLSGEYLSGLAPNIDYDHTKVVTAEISALVRIGYPIGVIIGGGNFWRGRDIPAKFDRAKADYMGMLASVMNGIFLSEMFAENGVKAHIMTPFPVGGFAELYNRDKAADYLDDGRVVIFPGGTGQPFFSTDTITVIRAAELSADVLFAKEVEGVCSSDPQHGGDYIVYREISYDDYIAKNLSVVDVSAVILAREREITCALFDLRAQNAIETAVKSVSNSDFNAIREIGTVFI